MGRIDDGPIWTPTPQRASESLLAMFIDRLRGAGVALPPQADHSAFAALHAWSIASPSRFWSAVWDDATIIADVPAAEHAATMVNADGSIGPPDDTGLRWFPGARLNFAENLLRHDGEADAIISWDERGRVAERSWSQLRREVAQLAAQLKVLGVRPGDRVAGWVPNIPEAIVAMLASAAIGAIWTSCSPDFGVDAVVDRFGQTEPVVLLFCDAYRYAGRIHECATRAATLLSRLPSVRHAIMIHYLGDDALPAARVMRWSDLFVQAVHGAKEYSRFPFDHPLYILYSSGTTGLPKCILHSAGGTLLQHVKEHRLHTDLRPGDRLFYFTTCGWMMWNWQVSALASGATLVLYDGAALPAAEPEILWRLAAEERVNVFGTSARYLALAAKAGVTPRARNLGPLRAVLSTGSPLSADSFDWVRDQVGAHVQTSSISGGTDIVSCFVLGNPISPVYRGEIQGPGLGMAVEVYDDDGNACADGEAGELVCTTPFPAMPVRFWNDPGGEKYRAAYFEKYPGVWWHGDWITRTRHGGYVIAGRSDTTLNPGGVRIGTAEIYRQVEAIDEVVESLVISQRAAGGMQIEERIVLFVRLRDGMTLDAGLRTANRETDSRRRVATSRAEGCPAGRRPSANP